jgi:hypothetical protein
MLCWLCLTLLAPAPAPQSAPPAAPPNVWTVPRRWNLGKSVPVPAPASVLLNTLKGLGPRPKVCSIPLLRVPAVKGTYDRTFVIEPDASAQERFPMPLVQLPAPPCDDWK